MTGVQTCALPISGVCNRLRQLHMHGIKTVFVAVQHGDQVDQHIVPSHSMLQLYAVVGIALQELQSRQVLQMFGTGQAAGGHRDAVACSSELFAHMPADKT